MRGTVPHIIGDYASLSQVKCLSDAQVIDPLVLCTLPRDALWAKRLGHSLSPFPFKALGTHLFLNTCVFSVNTNNESFKQLHHPILPTLQYV